MINLHIEAVDATDLHAQLAGLLGSTAAAAAAPAATNTAGDDAAPARRGRGKAAAAAPEADPPAQPDATQPLTRETIAPKATAYGQPSKGGAQALKELFIKHGSAEGKWSGVPDANLAALNAELDSLLA